MILQKLKKFLDTQGRKKRKRTERRDASDFLPSNATDLGLVAKILVANFEGLDGITASRAVAAAFAEESEVMASPLNYALKQPTKTTSIDRTNLQTEMTQRVLDEQKGALLVWGEMQDMGTSMTVRFSLPRGSEEKARYFSSEEPLEIPYPIPSQLRAVIISAALSILATSYKGPRKKIAMSLRSHLARIKNLLEQLPGDLSIDQSVSILNYFGNAAVASWSLGNRKDLILSEAAFDKALAFIDKKTRPLLWGRVRNNQASLLEKKGRKTRDSDSLKQAVILYQEVGGVLGRKARPQEWGLAWARSALVLYRLSSMELEFRELHLKASAEAFDCAIAVFDRDLYPAYWAELMNQYGIVLMVLGEHVVGSVMLEKSVKCFREVLKIRTRSAVPLLWAETANNLGAAGFALYKRVNDISLLKEASLCFEGAVDVFYRTQGYERRVSVISKNLDRVRTLLAQTRELKRSDV